MKNKIIYTYPVVWTAISALVYKVLINQEGYFTQYINLTALGYMILLTFLMQCMNTEIRLFWESILSSHVSTNQQRRQKVIKHTMGYWRFAGMSYILIYFIDITKNNGEGVIWQNISMAFVPALYIVIGNMFLFLINTSIENEQG